MAGETLLLGVVAVIALVAPDSCFFPLKLQEPLAALLRALQAFEYASSQMALLAQKLMRGPC